MKIGLIAAVPEEINTLHQDLSFADELVYAERTYYIGNYNDAEIVLVYSRIGKVAASITACTLIEKFNVDTIIFTGLAGAVPGNLNRGDIVLADQAYQHDLDARPLCDKQFEVPLTGRRLLDLTGDEFTLAQQAIRKFIDHLDDYVKYEDLQEQQLQKPRFKIGTIATGDHFISDVTANATLTNNKIQPLAVEMEGAAIAQVCAEHQIPFILIRIISDKADGSAHDNLQAFSEKLASRYASGIVQQLLKLLDER